MTKLLLGILIGLYLVRRSDWRIVAQAPGIQPVTPERLARAVWGQS